MTSTLHHIQIEGYQLNIGSIVMKFGTDIHVPFTILLSAGPTADHLPPSQHPLLLH